MVGALAAGDVSAGPEPARYIVGGTSRSAVQAAKRGADSVYRVIDLGPYPTAVVGVYSEGIRTELGQRADVEYVERDVTHEVVGQVLSWGIDRVDADVALADGKTGGDSGGEDTGDSGGDSDGDSDGDSGGDSGGDDTGGGPGPDIAIIDTGIDDDHPDLHDNLATPLDDADNHRAFRECRGSNCNYPWSDDHDHGTHVGGVAAAIDDREGVVGVATDATLHAAKVCNKAGSCPSSDIAAALDWAAENGFDVANLSFGGEYSETVDNAGKRAYDAGVLLVAAAGNAGPCVDCVDFPAANEEFVAVSATNCEDALAGFSSTGCAVELAGPGANIYSSVIGGYDTVSGTSMAAPHVAGAGAQLMDDGYANAEQRSTGAEDAACYPTRPGGAREQLQDTAEDLDLGGTEQGHGLVDVAAALGLNSGDDGLGTGPNCGDGTDGGGGGDGADSGGGDNPPDIARWSATEGNPDNLHAEIIVDWDVSDTDGDLDTITVFVEDEEEADETFEKTTAVSGSNASGRDKFRDRLDWGDYEVTLTVTDANGNSTSDTKTVDA